MLVTTPLSGTWFFALDPDGRGEAEAWFDRPLADTIALPGSVDEAEKTPLAEGRTMAHLTRRHPYVGQAWYAREFDVPEGAAELYHTLVLERPHGEVVVWIDSRRIGRDESLSTANRFLIGQLPAGTHRLVLRIDNSRFEAVGQAIADRNPDVAHSTTEHTQTNWNGVVGSLCLEACRAAIARVDVHAPSREARVHVELEAFDPDIRWPTYWTEPGEHLLTLTFRFAGVAEPLTIQHPLAVGSAYVPLDIPVHLPEAAGLWDEFNPNVHRLEIAWTRDGVLQDRVETSFGIRSFRVEDKRFVLNGRPVFLRGTLDCCIFPLTGYPPTDHAGWRKVFGTVQAYGLNHLRYHSYCPPRAAFEVADEMGILLHVETPIWAILGQDPALDRYIHAEAERIVRDYGNHPSFVMLTVGNEVHGPGLHAFLERFVEHWKATDPRRVYNGGSGWPTTSRADYVSKPDPRNQRWGDGLEGRLNARPLETRTDWSDWRERVPMALVSHETGQWCVYPNLAEIDKYAGVLEARNFLAVRDDLAEKGRLDEAEAMLMASGKLQTLLYKEEMEAALRTRGFAGTQLLGLQDFPGQGTALVGLVDAFWDAKPYVTAEEFRQFAGPVVPLLRADGFVLTKGATFEADLQLAQFGPEEIRAEIAWELMARNGTAVASGRIPARPLASGALHDIGAIRIATGGLAAPEHYVLRVRVDGTPYRNQWSLWVFETSASPTPLDIVETVDEEVLARLAAGETLVLMPPPSQLTPNAELGFTTIFWNTLWTNGQPPHTLGLLIDDSHPAFAQFPTGTHSDWHWWEPTHGRRPLEVAGLPVRPVVRVIDDWNTNRDLVLLAEARVGPGRLVLSGFDLRNDLANRPVSQALRNALAAALAQPAPDLPALEPAELKRWWARVSVSRPVGMAG